MPGVSHVEDGADRSQALQRSESMLAAAQRVAQLGAWELDPRTGEALFSAETLRILQVPSTTLHFAEFLARFQTEGEAPFEPVLTAPVTRELRLALPGGHERWVRWISQPVLRAPGEPVVVGTLQDISAAKGAERRLRSLEGRFQLLWTTTPDVVVMLGTDNRIRFINPAVRELLGHEPSALVGEDFALLQPERLREPHRHGFRRYLQTGVRRLDWRATEAIALHRDGRELPVELSFSDMDLDGERIFAACIRDLSARKRQEQALQQSEASYRRIVETAAEGIWLLDEAGATRFVNPFMAAMLGHAAEAMAGRSLTDFLADLDPAPRLAEQQRLQQADAPARELRLRHAGGADVWTRVVSNPIRDADGAYLGALAMVTDITDRRLADAARQLLAEQLREAQKMEAIGALAGGIAHDFNNVLAAILGNVALALDGIDAAHPASACLRQIEKGGLRGRQLVAQILSFARRQPQLLQSCELNALVEDATGLLRSTLPPGAGLSLQLARTPVAVHADATQIGQVVMNLCKNAVQALQGGDGAVVVGTGTSWLAGDTAARVQLPPGRYVHLWVRDSGHGMAEATLARIFEPFFTTKAASEGTGLGLAVVHGIVGSHGGGIAVDSAPGAGSCFHVYLPPSDQAPDADPRRGPAGRVATARGRGERVLYVDDDDLMLAMVEQLLRRLGYDAMVVGSANEALAAVRAAPGAFAAVVTDFNMPGLSGLDLAAALAAVRGDLPVVVSSGNVTELLAAESARLGVRAVVQKQNLVDELGEVLASLLAAQ